MKTSRFSIPQCATRSALDRNLIANASSMKPNTTLRVFIHPPDLGKLCNRLGNNANKPKGKAKAKPNPVIPILSWVAPSVLDKEPASNEPKIGPVHEKETIARVRAIRKIPMIPPVLFDAKSSRFAHDEGRVSS